MTDRAELPQRYPRLFAGLWFGTFVAVVQLMLGLAFSLIVSRSLGGYRRPLVPALSQGYLLIAAACVGAWLGSALLTRRVSAAEGARRGAWIGILSGIASALVSLLSMLPAAASPEGRFRWPTAAWVVVLVLFRGGGMLPVGALAGWCLVRVSQLTRRSKRERTAT